MNNIGSLIKKRRKQLGLSAAEVAAALRVSAQTVLNLEKDGNYNIGTRMLRRLEEALSVEFHISMKENDEMNERIRMGNDEFILHIRKHYNCDMSNPQIGHRVWVWLRDNASGEQVTGQEPSLWGRDISAVGNRGLPGSATQFEFRLDALPDLYRFLGQLASGGETADEWEGEE